MIKQADANNDRLFSEKFIQYHYKEDILCLIYLIMLSWIWIKIQKMRFKILWINLYTIKSIPADPHLRGEKINKKVVSQIIIDWEYPNNSIDFVVIYLTFKGRIVRDWLAIRFVTKLGSLRVAEGEL